MLISFINVSRLKDLSIFDICSVADVTVVISASSQSAVDRGLSLFWRSLNCSVCGVGVFRTSSPCSLEELPTDFDGPNVIRFPSMLPFEIIKLRKLLGA